MATVQAPPSADKQKTPRHIPGVWPLLVTLFDFYLQRYIPRHFHAVALSQTDYAKSIADSEPLVVYLNHASWWDPLMALVICKRFFPKRQLHAPIDAIAVQKYPFMQRLGFFPVEQDRLRGAGEFLKTARLILDTPNTSVWLTPEGQFTDPRRRDLAFQPGLAHLASKLKRGVIVPLAMEYTFWEERLPEALGRFGEPIVVQDHNVGSKEAWGHLLEERLRGTQRELETLALARESESFQMIFSGKSGVSWGYDTMRAIISMLTGHRIASSHSDKLQ